MRGRRFPTLFLLVISLIVIAVVVVALLPHSKNTNYQVKKVNNVESTVGKLSQSTSNLVDISWLTNDGNYRSQPPGNHGNHTLLDPKVHVVVTVCGHSVKLQEQLLVLLKSMVITSDGEIIGVVIVTDVRSIFDAIIQKVSVWPKSAQSSLHFTYIPVWYPGERQWLKTFRTPCTTERLYYPTILSTYDAVIHVDVDIIFLRPIKDLWSYFSKMKNDHLMALVAEHEDPADAYYNSPVNRIPHFGQLGLNAGVILMNLTRLRQLDNPDWISSVHQIYDEYREAPLHFADQDILNIYFSFHQNSVLQLPCNWNYRNDFCRFKPNTCSSAGSEEGIALLHGNRGTFLSKDEPAFKAVYDAFLKYNWAFDVRWSLVDPMIKALSGTSNTLCGIEPLGSFYTKYLHSRFG